MAIPLFEIFNETIAIREDGTLEDLKHLRRRGLGACLGPAKGRLHLIESSELGIVFERKRPTPRLLIHRLEQIHARHIRPQLHRLGADDNVVGIVVVIIGLPMQMDMFGDRLDKLVAPRELTYDRSLAARNIALDTELHHGQQQQQERQDRQGPATPKYWKEKKRHAYKVKPNARTR